MTADRRTPRRTLVFGGTGFVGLNIAERLLTDGEEVFLFDRLALPDAARDAFAALPGRLHCTRGDVTDAEAVRRAMVDGLDTVVLGAAVTADAAREARDPEGILQVNLMALPTLLRAARDAGAGRVINLSSAAVYGRAALGVTAVDEDTPAQPAGLYGITKLASEQIVERLGALWSMSVVSLRLSALFGPWERATGVRDTVSAPTQIIEAARCGTPALLSRPGMRDWTHASDAAHAVQRVAAAPALQHSVYNVSSGAAWSALAWGQALAALRPGFVCRLVAAGDADQAGEADERPTVDLHTDVDRAPLSIARLCGELGWRPLHDLQISVVHVDAWCRTHMPPSPGA